jgi:molybdate transport system ATP-binding protein
VGWLEAKFRLARGEFVLDAAFALDPGRVLGLYGPSGAGKTTLLACLAGLLEAPDGFLSVDGATWQDTDRRIFVPSHRRALGYVFQDGRLFPHLTVKRNLEYGWRRTPRPRRRLTIESVADMLDLGPLLHRRPDQLSGGQKQRVAVGRALLTSPRLLLLDEPLASLDREAKDEIGPYLVRLRTELSLTMIYVSHSMRELGLVADEFARLDRGRLSLVQRPEEKWPPDAVDLWSL